MKSYVVQIRDNIDTNLWRGVVEWTTCAKRKVTGVDKPTPEGVVRFRHLKWTVYLDCAHRFERPADALAVADGLRFTYGKEAIRVIVVTVEKFDESSLVQADSA